MSGLVEKAEAAAERAYAPYSRYRVGAVVRTTDGREFEGVNVENAAYPLGICAEKSAIGISASPCGGCRQWLTEFRVGEVGFRRAGGAIARYGAADLLPETWELPGR